MNEFIVPQWFVWLFLFSFGAAILALATERVKEIEQGEDPEPIQEAPNDLEWRILMRRVEEARRDLAA